MKLEKLLIVGIVSTLTMVSCGPRFKGLKGKREFSPALSKDSRFGGIIGGSEIDSTDSIKQSIVAVYDSALGKLCTGSLLENNVVLTAAHCVGPNPEAMLILFDTQVSQRSIFRPVDKSAVSPYWKMQIDNDRDTGDIALLHFIGDLPEGYTPAQLLKNPAPLTDGTDTLIAGFGSSNSETGEGPGTLRKAIVTIANSHFSATEITLDQRKGVGACHGDSGGPAYIKIDDQYYLWGVTSRGVGTTDNDCRSYSAYTTVTAHATWIERMTKKLSRSLVDSDALLNF